MVNADRLRDQNEALMAQVEELMELSKPFAQYACSPTGECSCHNCLLRDALDKYQPSTNTGEEK
jgi:hypothetical protein